MLAKTVADVSKHSAIYTAPWVVNIGLRLALLPVFTRYMSPLEYGALALVDSIVEPVRIISTLGLDAAMVRLFHGARQPHDKRHVIQTSLTLASASAVVMGLLLYPFGTLPNLILGTGTWTILFRLALIRVLVGVLANVSQHSIAVEKRSLLFAAFDIVQIIVSSMTSLILVVAFNWGAVGMMTGALTGALASVTLAGSYAIRTFGVGIQFTIARRLLSFGAPLVPSMLAAALLHNLDRVFLHHYAGTAEVGIYSLGYQFPFFLSALLLSGFGAAWDTATMYEVAQSRTPGRLLGQISTYWTLVATWAFTSLAISGKWIVAALAPAEFQRASLVIPLVSAGLLVYAFHAFLRTGISIAMKTHLMPPVYITAALVNVVANMLLIPRWGAMGAAWATCCSYVAFTVIAFVVYRKYLIGDFEWMRIGVVLTTAVSLYGLSTLLAGSPALTHVVGDLGLIAALPPALWLLGWFRNEEKVQIAHWWRSMTFVITQHWSNTLTAR